MASLAEIRARLAAAESNKGGQSQGGDNAIYPHWNMPEGSSANLRFLPDGNSKNTFFWVERAMIRLPFNGIKGEAESKMTYVQVPCVEMWGEACPVLAEVRGWFKDKALEEMGRKYWKKRSYIFQGFVRENPLSDDKTPENPIRRFIIGPQIFTLIKSALMDPDLTEMPTDYAAGLDFRVTKTTKGGYADYNTSKWARKESALTASEAEAIEKHGLYDLASFLPKKPGDVELKVIKEMFEASVDGQPFDMERWDNTIVQQVQQHPQEQQPTLKNLLQLRRQSHHQQQLAQLKPMMNQKQQRPRLQLPHLQRQTKPKIFLQ